MASESTTTASRDPAKVRNAPYVLQEGTKGLEPNKNDSDSRTDEHIEFSRVMAFWKNIGHTKTCATASLTHQNTNHTDQSSCPPKRKAAETNGPKKIPREGETGDKPSSSETRCVEITLIQADFNNMASCLPKRAFAETNSQEDNLSEKETGLDKPNPPEISSAEVRSIHQELNNIEILFSPPVLETKYSAMKPDSEEKSFKEFNPTEFNHPEVCNSESRIPEVNLTSLQNSSDSDSSSPDDNTSDTEEELGLTSASEEENENEFDFESYIEAICQRGEDSDSELSETNSNSSKALTRRAVRKVIKKLRKTSTFVAPDSEASETCPESTDSDDESCVESSSDDSVISEDDSPPNTDAVRTEVTKETRAYDQLKTNQVDAARSDNKSDLNVKPIDVDKDKEADDFPASIFHQGTDGEMASLSSGMASALRWPSSNFYIKQLDTEQLSAALETPLPSYRSKRSSTSVSGRRRNVMLGRVWWVEWWAQ